ncbi:MAG: universal stress protein [Pseudomonadota bacterium]
MPKLHNVLLAIQQSDEASEVLEKLQRMIPNTGPQPHVSAVRVVYDAMVSSRHVVDADKLQRYILDAESPYLRDAIDDCNTWIEPIEDHTTWHKVVWQGIVETASQNQADLIIKHISDADQPRLLHTPDDWNLLRHSPCPVLLTRARPWAARANVVAAVDTFDTEHRELNVRILESAKTMAAQLHATLHIVCVFPLVANWLDQVTSVSSYQHLKAEIEADVINEVTQLCQAQQVMNYELHAREGLAEIAIEQLVEAQQADLLIVGTNARQGISGFVLGNTAEKILSHTTADVLTIP